MPRGRQVWTGEPSGLRRRSICWPPTPLWGSGWKAAVKQYYNRAVSLGMQGECPAYRQNYADLDPTYRDTFGNPLIRITFNFTDNERRMVRYLAEKVLTQIVAQTNPAIQRVGDTITNFDSVPYQSTHINGG